MRDFRVLALSASRCSKTGQEAPKTAPRRPDRPPREPQDGLRASDDGLRGAHDSSRAPEDGPREAQKGGRNPKIQTFRPKRPTGGPKRPARGSKRPPSGPHRGPKRRPDRPRSINRTSPHSLPLVWVYISLSKIRLWSVSVLTNSSTHVRTTCECLHTCSCDLVVQVWGWLDPKRTKRARGSSTYR